MHPFDTGYNKDNNDLTTIYKQPLYFDNVKVTPYTNENKDQYWAGVEIECGPIKFGIQQRIDKGILYIQQEGNIAGFSGINIIYSKPDQKGQVFGFSIGPGNCTQEYENYEYNRFELIPVRHMQAYNEIERLATKEDYSYLQRISSVSPSIISLLQAFIASILIKDIPCCKNDTTKVEIHITDSGRTCIKLTQYDPKYSDEIITMWSDIHLMEKITNRCDKSRIVNNAQEFKNTLNEFLNKDNKPDQDMIRLFESWCSALCQFDINWAIELFINDEAFGFPAEPKDYPYEIN